MSNEDRRRPPDVSSDTLLRPFASPVQKTPVSPLYAVGLVVVTAGMVLLPVAYAALIVLTAYAVRWHLTNDAWILNAGGAGLIRALVYFGPAAAGVILLFFMVKPFFARSRTSSDRVTLDPESAPVLFALITRICAAIGAPTPVRVEVDCSVNAGARFVGGPLELRRRQLVVTIGLPLAAGLTMQQLAGVLAHEFGHFAQGTGMRLTFAIRSINQWFWRVVHERDEWDVMLESWSRNTDFRVGAVFWMASGAILCTRRVLWALMMLGHLISCLMLRQMEYDADSYEVKVSGSDAFTSTMAKLSDLNLAARLAYADVRNSWLSGCLPNDFAALVVNKCADLPPELIAHVEQLNATPTRRWFDTHPSSAQRIAAAQRLAKPGVFEGNDRATTLFADFDELSKAATRHHYELNMNLDLGGVQLIDTNEAMENSRKIASAAGAVQRLLPDGVNALRPIVIDAGAPDVGADPVRAWQTLQAARSSASADASACAAAQKRFGSLEDQKLQATAARHLISAGYHLKAGTLGSFDSTTEAADAAIARITAEQDIALRQLRRFENNLGQQLRAASTILSGGYSSSMVHLLTVMTCAYPAVLALWRQIVIFDYVSGYVRELQNPERLNPYVQDLENLLRKLVDRVRASVADTPYPFARAGVQRSLPEYLRAPGVTTEDVGAVLTDARAHVNLFFELYWRVVGELALMVEQIEANPPVCPPPSSWL